LASDEPLRDLLVAADLGAEAVALCEWLESHDWDFRAAAELRGVEARALYREWLVLLGWNQSLASRLYRKPGSTGRGVTRQAIDAHMKALGVVRPLELDRQLATQDVAGALDAMRAVHGFVEGETSTERLCCEQLLTLADTYRRMGAVAEARATLVEVIKIARRIDTPELAGRAMRAVPYLLFQTSPYGREDREFIDILEGWAPALRDLGDREALALCLARLGFELYGMNREGSRERALQLTKEAHELARDYVTPRTRAAVAGCRIAALSDPERLDERLQLIEQMVDEARTTSPDDRYFSLDMLLTDLIESGRVDEIGPVRSELRELEESCSAPWPQRYRVTLAILQGDWEEADRLAVLPPTMPMSAAAQIRGLQQYEALKLRGDWENLAGLVRWNANQQPEFIGYRFCLAQLSCLLGQTGGVDEELDQWAHQDFACVPTDFLRVPNLCILAEVSNAMDRPDHAEALHRLLAPFAERIAVVRVTAAIQGSVARYLGLLEHTLERWDEANAHFEQATHVHERLGARPYLAWTRYDHACMLRESGRDRGLAADLARAASGEAAALGMSWLVERTRSLIQPLD
jgi:tetratricopeptide (TPR) repeat protein